MLQIILFLTAESVRMTIPRWNRSRHLGSPSIASQSLQALGPRDVDYGEPCLGTWQVLTILELSRVPRARPRGLAC